jgi:uncharacterized repeat protein (TIGR01451 family)
MRNSFKKPSTYLYLFVAVTVVLIIVGVSVSADYSQINKLTADVPTASDYFGTGVSVSGEYAIVGANNDDDTGTAYIYAKDQGGADNWGQLAKLTADDGATSDAFGTSAAIDGDYAIIGAFNNDTTGSAYIFYKDQGGVDNWGQLAKLNADDAGAGDFFGNAVAISGNYVIVGANLEAEAGMMAGAAYVFSKDEGGVDNWGQVTKLTGDDTNDTDYFAQSVSISGNYAVVGAYAKTNSTGAAYVFSKDEGGVDNWGQLVKLAAGDAAESDRFGIGVAIDGDLIIVGADGDVGENSYAGAAYIFSVDQGGDDNWGQVTKLVASPQNGFMYFGSGVAIDGDNAVVGAIGNGVSTTGIAYMYSKDQGGADNWGEYDQMTASDEAANNNYGANIGISGSYVIVGASGDDTNTGGVYLFYESPDTPTAPSSCSNIGINYYHSRALVSWTDNADNEVNFVLETSTDDVTYTEFSTPDADATSETVTGLADGNTYYFRVKATNGDGDSTYATCGTMSVSEQPTPPSNCYFEGRNTDSISLRFKDNSDDESGFFVRYSTSPGVENNFLGQSWSNLDGTGTYHGGGNEGDGITDTNTQLYVYVAARNADLGAGNSDYISCGSAYTRFVAPSTPTISSPADAATEVSLNPALEFSGTQTGTGNMLYRLELSTSSTFTTTNRAFDMRDSTIGWDDLSYATTETATFTLPSSESLTSNTTYYWRVKAIGIGDEHSAYTTARSFTTIASSPEEDDNVAFLEYLDSIGYLDTTNSSAFDFRTNETVTLPTTSTFNTAVEILSNIDTDKLIPFDADSDGDLDLAVLADGSDDKVSYVYLNDGSGSFTQGSAIGTNEDIDVGDIDNDGDLDIVRIQKAGAGVYWHANNGSGTFTEDITSIDNIDSTNNYQVALSDYDKDGDLDVFTASSDDAATGMAAYVNALTNQGSVSFNLSNGYSFTTNIADDSGFYAVGGFIMPDLNNDNFPDIVVGANVSSEGQTAVFINNADWGHTTVGDNKLSAGNTVVNILAVDLDNDGDLDIFEGQNNTETPIFLNHGNATGPAGFTNSSESINTEAAHTSHAADVDGDGDQDILVSNATAVYLYRNYGDATFSASETFYTPGVGDAILWITSGDFNGDGLIDIILADQEGDDNVIITGATATNFTEEVVEESGDNGLYNVLAVFDSDNDGDQDLWVENQNFPDQGQLEIWVNDGTQTYTKGTTPILTLQPGAHTRESVVADFDGDGDLDVANAKWSEINSVYLNQGSNTFTEASLGVLSLISNDVLAFDVDNDGDLDLAFLNDEAVAADELYLNNGSGSFSQVDGAPFGTELSDFQDAFDAGDVDGDGDIDVVIPLTTDADIYLNDGTGEFTLGSTVGFDGGESYHSVKFGDFDNDGDLDLAVGSVSGDTVDSGFIWINDGHGNFDQGVDIVGIGHPAVLDFDHDGDLDIVAGNRNSNNSPNRLIRNMGNLSFVAEEIFGSQNDWTTGTVVGDYDSDGDYDVFFRNDFQEDLNYNYYQNQTYTTGTNYSVLSGEVDSTDDTISAATLTVTDQTPTGGSIDYYLASNYTATSTWATLDASESDDFLNVTGWDGNAASLIAVGANGSLKYSSDAGSTFIALEDGLSGNINDAILAGINSLVLAVGDGGSIFQFNTNSSTWGTLCAATTTENLNALSNRQDHDTVYVVGDNGTIIKMDISTPNSVSCELLSSGVDVNLNDIENNASNSAAAVGEDGTFIFTENSGTTWTALDPGVSVNLNSMSTEDQISGYIIVGDSGTVVQFDDPVFSTISSGVSVNLNAVDARSSVADVWAVGDSGTVLYSDDSGATWTNYTPDGETSNFNGIVDVDGLTIAAVGEGGVIRDFTSYAAAPIWEGPITSGEEWDFTDSGSTLYWKAVMSAGTATYNPILNNLSISYSTAGGSAPPPSTPTAPSAPTVEAADVVSAASIQWNFADTSDRELGFKLYDADYVVLETKAVPDSGVFIESELLPNTEYVRYVSAYSNDGDSSVVGFEPVYTLANVPAIDTLTVSSSTSINLSIDENDNSNVTEYAIYDTGTDSWLQADSTMGEARIYQTHTEWLDGESAIAITELTNNAMYSLSIMAQNGDGVETEFSASENIIVYRPMDANIVLTKKVGVNESDEIVGIYFGQPVFASSQIGESVKNISFIEQITNSYIYIALGVLLLSLLLLLLNAHPRLKHAKHAHTILFKDLKGKKHDTLFELLHGKSADKDTKSYKNHYHFYKLTSLGVAGVGLGIIIKIMVVLVAAVLVYGGVTVHAFQNDSGDAVYENDILTYQITYTNNGNRTASNVVLSDSIPTGTTYLANSLSNTEDCFVEDSVVSCELGSMARDVSASIEFKTTVTGSIGETVINYATASFDQGSEPVNSNSVTNDIISDVDPDLIGAGETFEATLTEGWNYIKLTETAKVQFSHRSGTHTVELIDADLEGDKASLRVTSDPIDVDISTGDSVQVDSDSNGVNDLALKTQSVEDDEIATIGIAQVTEPVIDGPVCGNDTCEDGEACDVCMPDCGVCEIIDPIFCGNSTCEAGESCSSCSADCGVCPPNELVCGNSICETGEICSNCATDCGACPPPPPPPGAFCGDFICDETETCTNCEDDCGACEVIVVPDPDPIIPSSSSSTTAPKPIEEPAKPEYEKTAEERILDVEEITEKIVQVLKIEDETVKAVVKTAIKVKQVTLDNKVVEKINDVVEEPILAATAVTSIAAVATVGATGATGASVLTYLQFLITTPLGLFSRRKRKGWGIVYNSITKKPLDLAIVRLYRSDTKKLIRTKVTDKLGRYQFIVKPGMYYIEVGKKEYAFPSKLLDNQETDGEYLNVYYGGDIQITEDGAINQPIAVDPDKKDLSNAAVIKRFVLKRVQTVFTLLGPILALISLVISPSWWIFGLLVAQIVMLVVFRRLATGQKPTSFGTVMDKLKKHPLGRAVVRVFDTKYHKLLDTRITNGKGKYAFLVGNDVYYMTSEKSGYHPHRTEKVDLTTEDSGYLAEDIRMTPAGMKLEQGQEHAVAVRSTVGRQEEKQVNGLQKVVRREEESFKGDIKDVKLDDMHEEYYDVDVLSKK